MTPGIGVRAGGIAAAVEQAWLLTKQLVTVVTGHVLQGLIDLQNRAVQIGDQHAIASGLQSFDQQPIPLLQPMPGHRLDDALGQLSQEVEVLDDIVEGAGAEHARCHFFVAVRRDH